MKTKSPDPRAVFLLATLKHKRGGGEFSHTETLCELVIENLREHGVRSEIVRLVEYDIPPGTKSNMGKGDDWPVILKKVLAADILVFATPIWWGNHSSLMQRAIERLDEIVSSEAGAPCSQLTHSTDRQLVSGYWGCSDSPSAFVVAGGEAPRAKSVGAQSPLWRRDGAVRGRPDRTARPHRGASRGSVPAPVAPWQETSNNERSSFAR